MNNVKNEFIRNDISEIQKRLMEAKKSSHLTYDKLEAITGISHATIQRYFTGTTEKIPFDAIVVLANAMGVTARHILGWEENDTERIAREIADIIAPLSETDRDLVIDLARKVTGRLQQKEILPSDQDSSAELSP